MRGLRTLISESDWSKVGGAADRMAGGTARTRAAASHAERMQVSLRARQLSGDSRRRRSARELAARCQFCCDPPLLSPTAACLSGAALSLLPLLVPAPFPTG